MKPQNQQKILEFDAGLDSDSRRSLARCREFFGVDELTAETATAAAQNITKALSAMAANERHLVMYEIISALEEIQEISRRLDVEKTRVASEVHSLSAHRKATTTYSIGGRHVARNKI